MVVCLHVVCVIARWSGRVYACARVYVCVFDVCYTGVSCGVVLVFVVRLCLFALCSLFC